MSHQSNLKKPLQLEEWLTRISQLHPKEIALGLQRTSEVAKRLACLEFNCPVITVGGTNGKGSCIAMLSAIYAAAGYRVASYTSPHLIDFNERIQIAGTSASDDDICQAFSATEQARGDILLTYFEYSTLAGLYCLQRANPDVVLLEVGMGGRLDAVNCVDTDLALITSIALDHCQWLGETREKIAIEKAGIFRAERPVICGDPQPPAILEHIAQDTRSPYYQQGRDFHYHEHGEYWEWQNQTAHLTDLPYPQPLHCQNASSVLQAIDCMQSRLPTSNEAIHQGLASVKLPGRLQWVSEQPRVLCDVAHNPESIANLAQFCRNMTKPGRMIAIFSMLADKDIAKALQPMTECIDEWHIATLDEPRAAPLARLEQCMQALAQTHESHPNILDAYQNVVQNANPDDIIVVFGSFHTVSAVIRATNSLKN